ncbi:MFS transporter [Modestobacter sp. SSW1-42]|uniref:MFS transporter n=1 Tax=Modestobacter sp. SSW1-42 TaxID=596372 RepID=UPI0039887550
MQGPAGSVVRTTSPVTLAVAGVVGFLVLGALASVLGPTLPRLRAEHGLGPAAASWLPAAFSAGSALGVGLAGVLRGRWALAPLLTGGALTLGAGCAAVPLAPGGGAVAGALLLAGVGFGVVDLLLNLTLARSFGAGSGAVLMAVSAAFGVSAVLTPVFVGAAPEDLVAPFGVCAVGAVALAVLAARLRTAGRPAPAGGAARRHPAGEAVVVGLLAAVLLGYVAVEGGVAGWETTHLLATTDLTDGQAARAVALFWLGLTVGRLLAAPLALRHHPSRLVVGSLVGAGLALALASSAPLAVAAYALAGLCLAPVFPAVIAWHADRVPSGRGATLVFAVGLAGPLVTSPVIGAVAEGAGAATIPWVLAALALAAAGGALVLVGRRSPRTPGPAGVQVILRDPAGHVLLQLRDDDPAIPFPGVWALPGGHLEDGELPVACAVRELREEMGLELPASALHHVVSRERSYDYEHTWWAALDVDPATIVLTEGQAVRLFSPAEISGMTLGYEDGAVLAGFFAEHADRP